MDPRSTLIPCVLYRDAAMAIAWLCEVFELREQLRVPGPDGSIQHAQLVHGGGMLMLGSLQDGEYGRHLREPGPVGGNTQGIYLVMEDVDAAYVRVQRAGGEILIPIKDEEYGGRGFTCRDPQGQLWSVGSYDPWAE
ncbi:VOC family protein [Pseudomonas sp. BMS12]|uniref:VOC family protein n=1 Tax=Pseudomonas sp. BMS12 TaxID=1796033 RepID=UPI00083A755C|nr:VOC family protein [Pseudomonas sp. BMS12]